MIIAIDSEMGGLDLWHGCKPFFIASLNDAGHGQFWQWRVNPFTREPLIPLEDIKEIQSLINRGYTGKHPGKRFNPPRIIFHNSKFDIRALERIGIKYDSFHLTDDTHIASHVVASAESHKLKDLALQYLDIPDDDQRELQDAVTKARRIAKKKKWRIADEFDPHWPSMKKPPKTKEGDSGFWIWDMWIPREIAFADNYPEGHPWYSLLERYAMTDVERTLGLYYVLIAGEGCGLDEYNLRPQYEARRKLIEVIYKMEDAGIPLRRDWLERTSSSYLSDLEVHKKKMEVISCGRVQNPRSPQQVQKELFGHLGLTGIKPTDTGFSTDADTLEELLETLRPRTIQHEFVKSLQAYRQQSKAIEYLESYEKGMLLAGTGGSFADDRLYYLLHPNFNIAGTDTTRLSSNNPNAQNISKKEGFNLRRVFGPLPGRVWYTLDYSNIELRIFAHASGDRDLIAAFASGYSVHLLVAELLYPDEFAQCKERYEQTGDSAELFKNKYESTLYQWIKNGNFSLIYGASQKKADATYHYRGAYKAIRGRFTELDRFMSAKFDEAKDIGYVTTIGGYRLQVSQKEPHKAVNYFVQGTAGWAMVLAMHRVFKYLERQKDIRIIMTIHDELMIDAPVSKHNYPILKGVKRLMESVGDDLGFKTPVDINVIKSNWSEESKFTAI